MKFAVEYYSTFLILTRIHLNFKEEKDVIHRTDLFYSHKLVYSEILFSLVVLFSLSNCWLAHLIFQDDKQSIFLRTMPWLIQFEMVSLKHTHLPFTRYCSEIYSWFSRGILKDHCVHAFKSPSRVSFLSTGGTVARIMC